MENGREKERKDENGERRPPPRGRGEMVTRIQEQGVPAIGGEREIQVTARVEAERQPSRKETGKPKTPR